MRLTDEDIEKWINEKKIIIHPKPNSYNIHGITVDLTLNDTFKKLVNSEKNFINLSTSEKNINKIFSKLTSNKILIKKNKPFFLKPNEFALAITNEELTLPNNIVGWLDGRSSLARIGLMIHATSHRIDPGWNGKIVLELFNSSNITLALYPGMLIAAISFEKLSKPVRVPYNNRKNAKYFKQKKIIGSKINYDLKNYTQN